MTWKAFVESDFRCGGIAIHLGDRGDGRRLLVRPMELVIESTDRTEAAYVSTPALRLPDELGLVLLDALAAHYGGAVDARTARADLLAERKRADRLIEALIAVATKPERS